MKFSLEEDKLLVLLIFTDLSFLFLHILHTYTGLLPGSYFSIAEDRGYGELFQYIKELWVAILFFLLGIRQRRALYFTFSLLFLYFLVDDSFELHEKLGAFLANFLDFQPELGLRALDFGELVVSALFGGLFFASIGLTHYLSDLSTRTVSKYVIAMIVLLVLFGILVDMVEIIVEQAEISRILKMIEESGEMIVMSFIAWFVFRITPGSDRIPFSFLGGEKALSDDSKD